MLLFYQQGKWGVNRLCLEFYTAQFVHAALWTNCKQFWFTSKLSPRWKNGSCNIQTYGTHMCHISPRSRTANSKYSNITYSRAFLTSNIIQIIHGYRENMANNFPWGTDNKSIMIHSCAISNEGSSVPDFPDKFVSLHWTSDSGDEVRGVVSIFYSPHPLNNIPT